MATAGLLLAAAPGAHARPGDLDKTFAKTGRMVWNPYGAGGSVAGLALPDGLRPLLSINASRNGTWGSSWVRFTTLGRLAEQTSMPAPIQWAPAIQNGHALARVGDGVYQLTRLGGSPVTLTVPVGGFDQRSFGVDAAGRAILVGTTQDPTPRAMAVRFLGTGALDTSYGTGGVATFTELYVVASAVVQRNSGVVAIDGTNVVALDAQGRPQPSFIGGKLPVPRYSQYPRAARILQGPGRTLLVVGRGGRNAYVARMRPDGQADRRFGTRGVVDTRSVLWGVDIDDVALDRKGRIVLAGSHTLDDVRRRAVVVRLQARGKVDRTFGTRGRKLLRLGSLPGENLVASFASRVAIDKRGRIVIAGATYNDEVAMREDFGEPFPAIARLRG